MSPDTLTPYRDSEESRGGEASALHAGTKPTLAQIFELRVYCLYQFDFLTFQHPLYLLFSSNGRAHVIGRVEVYKLGNLVSLREAFICLVFVLINTPFKIIGYAGVQGAGLVRHDVHVVFFHLV